MVSLLGHKLVVVCYGLGRVVSRFLNLHWVRLGWVGSVRWCVGLDQFMENGPTDNFDQNVLESNSVIWSHCLKQHIERVEQVQRRFTNRFHGLRNCTYENWLKLLNLPSLKLRHLRNDLALCYKIVFDLTMLKIDDFFEQSHAFKLYKRTSVCRL